MNHTTPANSSSLHSGGSSAVAVATATDDRVAAGVRPAAPATEEPWPSPARAWYAVFVFALALMVNFLDRGILGLLVEPIKRDLHLTDVQMSLVMGFAFIGFYVILGLPVARLVDYKSRRTISGIGIAIWSFTTAFCGLARTFGQLFLCRVGVGVGESCSGPSTYSMLADLFPPHKLPRAIAVLNFGFYAGTGLSLIIGGTLATMFLRIPTQTLPVIGTLYGWQLTFFVVGIPGLIVAALMFTVREPKRRGKMNLQGAGHAHKPVPIMEVLRFMRENSRTFGPIFFGTGVQVLLSMGVSNWAPAFYMRRFHWTAAKYGLIQGVLALSILPLGSLLGGMLAERFAKKGHHDANLRVVLLASLFGVPFTAISPLMPTATLAVVCSICGLFIGAWSAAPLNAALQVITPNQMRGQITALFMFVFNVIGMGFGPTLVALMTQYVFRSEAMLGQAMSAVVAILGPLAILSWVVGRKPYGVSVARAKAWS